MIYGDLGVTLDLTMIYGSTDTTVSSRVSGVAKEERHARQETSSSSAEGADGVCTDLNAPFTSAPPCPSTTSALP